LAATADRRNVMDQGRTWFEESGSSGFKESPGKLNVLAEGVLGEALAEAADVPECLGANGEISSGDVAYVVDRLSVTHDLQVEAIGRARRGNRKFGSDPRVFTGEKNPARDSVEPGVFFIGAKVIGHKVRRKRDVVVDEEEEFASGIECGEVSRARK
jgi:hypothetical protein